MNYVLLFFVSVCIPSFIRTQTTLPNITTSQQQLKTKNCLVQNLETENTQSIAHVQHQSASKRFWNDSIELEYIQRLKTIEFVNQKNLNDIVFVDAKPGCGRLKNRYVS